MANIINLFGGASTRSAAPPLEGALQSPTSAKAPAQRSNAMAIAKAMANGFHRPDAGPGLDAATVARLALRWVQRRGRKMSSLPALIRLELDAHCRAGDPTTTLIRDWIEGRSPLLSCSGIEGIGFETPIDPGIEVGRGQQ